MLNKELTLSLKARPSSKDTQLQKLKTIQKIFEWFESVECRDDSLLQGRKIWQDYSQKRASRSDLLDSVLEKLCVPDVYKVKNTDVSF